MKSLVSIHDVSPRTLPDVIRVVELMDSLRLAPAPLLLCAGSPWQSRDLATVRQLAEKGHPLVAHGWTHEARAIRGMRHRLHALLLSRNVAEHLSLSDCEINELLQRCSEWFEARSLPAPAMYVPPAWALGPVTKEQLQQSPFRWFETLSGIYDSQVDRFQWLPLLGFQADTRARKLVLRVLNGANVSLARWSGRAVRVAIHPEDQRLLMGGELARLLGRLAEGRGDQTQRLDAFPGSTDVNL